MSEPIAIQHGDGFRYERDGRAWVESISCAECGEYGCFADTYFCADCEPTCLRLGVLTRLVPDVTPERLEALLEHGLAVEQSHTRSPEVEFDGIRCHPFVLRVNPNRELDRPHRKRAIDELVTGPVDAVHIEQMDAGLYWMAITKDGERQVFSFSSVSERAAVVVTTEAE